MVNLDNLEGVVLGSLCTFQAGVAFPDRFQGKSSGDMPFIKVSDMKSPRNRYQIREANNWVDVDEAKEMGAKPAPKGSIVFAKIGLGLLNNRFRITTEPTLIDNNMMAAIPNEKIKEAFVKRSHVNDSYLDSNENLRGFSGPCLPKDVRAMSHFANINNIKAGLFDFLDKENDQYKKTVLEGMREE